MSFSYEDRTLSSSVVRNGIPSGSIAYTSGATYEISAGSGSGQRVANQIASDLLLGTGSGSAGFSASSGALVGANSISLGYGSGAGASGAYGSNAGASAAFGSGAGASAAYGSGAGASGAYGSNAGASAAFGSGAGASAAFGSGAGNSVSISYSAGAGGSSAFLSEIEQAILRSSDPITINESEEITVNGQRGIWANRAEVVNWRGAIPITQYAINEDSNPELITKRTVQQLEYIQELAIRYLRPPTPPAPGEIIIQQQANTLTPPAPPLIIRQQPARPATPEPLVVREAPPQPPAQVGRK